MSGANAGRHGSRWKRLTANVRARRGPCGICGQPIDYALESEHPDSFTVDHIMPWLLNPERRTDPGNLRAAHRRCNSAKGMRNDKPGLGLTSRRW